MSRDELLTKLAMELEEWPATPEEASEADIMMPDGVWMKHNEARQQYVASKGGIPGMFVTKDEWAQRRTELINRPSWEDAPEWAQWVAQDEGGEWCFYPEMPEQSDDMWINDEPKTGIWVDVHCTGRVPAGHNWRDTLEPRPQAQATPRTCRHCDITFNRPHVDGIPDDRCTRCDDEIKALWPEPEPAKTWWTSKPCTECGHTTAAKVSDDTPVCPGCVALGCDDYAEDSDEESALSQAMEEQMRAAAEKWARGDMEARSKYHREVKPGVWIDVYDVLQAWGVKNSALQHLIKKALAPGERGHKTLEQDMADIVASAKRAKELEE